MPVIVLYFQMHQPLRLRRYTAFDDDGRYFDDALNADILRRVTERCYRPALTLLSELVAKHKGTFRFSLGVTGLLLEQLTTRHRDVVDLLRGLAASGCVEFTTQPYHHSLAFFHSLNEFNEQVALQTQVIRKLTGRRPTAFHNTELTYCNDMARWARGKRYGVMLTECVDAITGNPHHTYHPPSAAKPVTLLRDYGLSDDIAFRFCDRRWSGWPLTAEKFADLIAHGNPTGPVCNIFIDLESLGEHQPAESGIFDFVRALPQAVLIRGESNRFMTVSEAAGAFEPETALDVPKPISWADTPRDLSAWAGNTMQQCATAELYALEPAVKASGDDAKLDSWRKLTSADHFYYMATPNSRDDTAIHRRFNPYPSPFDAYIYFMNAVDDLKRNLAVTH